MPSSEEILASLGVIANDWQALSLLWHGYFAFLVLGLVFGLRPPRPVVGVLLALPFLSVSILAWVHANPFNGAFFALTGIILLTIAARLPGEDVKVASAWPIALGVLMVVFGWVYPHFIDSGNPIEYLYAAPTGLIPCPTLSIVIGFTLMLDGLRSRPWCLVLAAVGLFYGIFGAIRLGVKIDGVLLLGALATAYVAFSRQRMASNHGATAR